MIAVERCRSSVLVFRASMNSTPANSPPSFWSMPSGIHDRVNAWVFINSSSFARYFCYKVTRTRGVHSMSFQVRTETRPTSGNLDGTIYLLEQQDGSVR